MRSITAVFSTVVATVTALTITAATGPGASARATPHATAPATTSAGAHTQTTTASWPMAGFDVEDSHANPNETTIGVSNVAQLTKKWSHSFTTTLAATPTVSGGLVFMSSYDGNVYALNAATGATVWSHAVTSWTKLPDDLVRASPAVYGADIIMVDRATDVPANKRNGTHLIAVKAATGALDWQLIVDPQKSSAGTGAPTVDGNIAYQGISSDQELSSSCCTFRGNVVAVNLTTHKLLWRTYTVPTGYTGAAVWGSSPAVDDTAGLVYVGTGNNYSVPAGVCQQPGQSGCTPVAAADHVDSVLALSTRTGKISWSFATLSSDVFSNKCQSASTCGPDFDFASDPNIIFARINGAKRTLVGIGQKTGFYYALDASTGQEVWSVQEGPDGRTGGIMWGSAVGSRIYSAVANGEHTSWRLPSGATTTGGFFSALNPATGAILWQTPDPQGNRAQSFMSTANGVVYGGTASVVGANMFAMNSANGQILWSYAGGGAIMGGAAIVNGVVYWEAGYYSADCPASNPTCTETYTLYAFSVPGT